MPAYKDKIRNTWYLSFRYKDWTGKIINKTKRGFKTRREALEWENKFKNMQAGQLDMAMKDFISVYREELFPRLKEVTRTNKEYIQEDKIIPYFGSIPINKITSHDVIKWQNELLKHKDENGQSYTPSYLKKLHDELNAIFNYAVRHYELPKNPASIAGNFGSDRRIEMDFWTTDEYLKFSETLKDEPCYYYYYQVLYWLGLREGEAFALTKADFDFEKKTVTINKTYQERNKEEKITTPKTPKSTRTISVPDFLCNELKIYFKMLLDDIPDGRIFFMLSKTNVTRKIKKKAEEAGVKKIRVHDLRHSHVSLLINLGYSAVAIADRMGHESVHITYRYAHLFPDVQSDIADKLNNVHNKKNKASEKEEKYGINRKIIWKAG